MKDDKALLIGVGALLLAMAWLVFVSNKIYQNTLPEECNCNN